MCIRYDRYKGWIKTLPKKRKSKNTVEHWILPESIGGTDAKNNKVWMTYEDHITAHKKLVQCFKSPKRDKMVIALNEVLN